MEDPHSKEHDDEGTAWREWLINRRADKTGAYEEDGRFGHFEVVEKTERKWEKWIKRLAKAKGEAYVKPLKREEKRRAWIEAKAWFREHQGLEETVKVEGETRWALGSFRRILERSHRR